MERKHFLSKSLLIISSISLFLVGCIPLEPAKINDILIQTSRFGHVTNVDLVYAKDGLSGNWIKLTGTNGVYKFTVNDPDGIYSVAAVSVTENDKQVYFFNAKMSEIKNVFLEFLQTKESDFATLTINVPATYNGERVSVFFLHEHGFPTVEEGKVDVILPKGKADLVFFVGNMWSETGVKKVGIVRNFEMNADKSITLTTDDLKDPENANLFEGIFFNWMIGGRTLAFAEGAYSDGEDEEFVRFGYKIPSSLKTNKDFYQFHFSESNYMYTEYNLEYPSTNPFDKNTINPASFSETPLSTETVSGNLKINLASYNPNVSGLTTVLYEFAINRYKELNVWGYPIVDVRYNVYISSGYLEKAGTSYLMPVINDTDFLEYNIKDNQRTIFYRIVALNGKLEDYFTIKDGLKVLEKWKHY